MSTSSKIFLTLANRNRKRIHMNHIESFKANTSLIDKFGINTAHLIWAMGLYLDESNLDELASESLTDGGDDKKIDFIKLDYDNKKIAFAQGYYTDRKVDSAPANKASDLNTASAWLISGKIEDIPIPLREIIKECREAIQNSDVEKIDLLYVHNLPESQNVSKELKTAQEHLINVLPKEKGIIVTSHELGIKELETLYTESFSQILISDEVSCPAEIKFSEKGEEWESGVMSVPGTWLRELFIKYGDRLFSANYRGFLGITHRKKKNINLDIKTTAEKQPKNFWVFNNGITILTKQYVAGKDKTILTGISIINGAQTTGSLSTLETPIEAVEVKVLARVIKCSSPQTIEDIIKYNNTQNEITSWDKFSNDNTQKRIKEEFKVYGHIYNLKRGFDDSQTGQIGIENVIQPLVSLLGYYAEANRGKNGLFLSDAMYRTAFGTAKARHILFAYCLNQTIDEIRSNLKKKREDNTIIDIEERQLALLRNLRFKNFLTAIIGKCLDVLLGKKIIVEEVALSPTESRLDNKKISEIISDLLGVVNFVLIYTTATVEDLTKVLEEKDSLKSVSNKVSALLHAAITTEKNKVITDFRKIMD